MSLAMIFPCVVLVHTSIFGQECGCTVPINVMIPSLGPAAEPKAWADAEVAKWDQHVRAMKSQLPHWEWAQEQPSGLLPGWVGTVAPAEGGGPNLTAQDFFAHDRKHPIAVRSITIDRGPRRIVFVVEDGKRMTPALWRIGGAAISGVLFKARAVDSFGLITGGGARVALRLGSKPDAIRAAVEQLPTRSTAQAEGVLDAVLEATNWLNPAEPGDAIFIVALDLRGKHHASFSKVREAVAAGRIRVFGVELGEGPPGPYFGDWSYEQLATVPNVGFGNVNHLALLVKSTGGLLGGPVVPISSPPPDLAGVSASAERMYEAISVYYDLQLDSAGKGLIVGLAPPVQDRFLWAFVSYPREPAACTAVVPPKAAAPSASK